MSEIRLNINNKEVKGYKGQTILEVAKENGIEIPTLCYDERVKIYGSCGLCVVELEGVPKLFRACATEISDGMIIRTNTSKVRSSRKVALELLLSDHVGDCRPPCLRACPGHTDCQGYVGLIANGEYKEAVKLIKEQLPLPASIGRVCPHPCEDECRRELAEEPVSIAWLKRFVADIDLRQDTFLPEIEPPTGKTVAIIGAGPAGLSAAYFLAQKGHEVIIFEAMPEAGGMLRYGIPQYRLPKDVVDKEVEIIKSLGVKILTNTKVGKDISFDYLKGSFDSVYIAIGAWQSSSIRCKGEDMEGVLGGIDFLEDIALGKGVEIGDKVAVVGGGNTAMDACRTAIRLGAKEVSVIYRRTRNEMPAEEIEIIEAEEEGADFKFLVSPIEIIGKDGKVSHIKLQKMELGEPDESGRRRPVPIEGDIEELEVDTIIAAIGQKVVADGLDGVETTDWGTIKADENTFRTNIPGVFAGGDGINEGPGIAIEAIGDAKKASEIIDAYLNGENIEYQEPYYVIREDLTKEDFSDREKAYRPVMPHLSPEERKTNFNEIVDGYSEEDARKDAMRCLECGCGDIFECKLIDYSNEYNVEPQKIAGEVATHDFEDDHPFIVRDPNKCILCGLCVRVCDEVMGVTALGLVNRGFDTIVKPEFDLPLKSTDCISCGQCVTACPTGALQERLAIEKPVPVDANEVESLCAYCSIGCKTILDVKGDSILRSLPDKSSEVDNGLLCVKGRFGFEVNNSDERIKTPMIRKNGELVEASWEEALLNISKSFQSIKATNGGESLALLSSARLSNEEAYLAYNMAKDGMETTNIGAFDIFDNEGIKDVLGMDTSTNSLEELLSTDVILLVGTDLMENHPIAGIKVRQAAANGTKIIVINDKETKEKEIADKYVIVDNNINTMKSFIKSTIENGFTAGKNKAIGFKELENSIKNVEINAEIDEISKIYGEAKKAMILYDDSKLTQDSKKALANIAVISGKIGTPRSGLISLKKKNNSQGLADIGFNITAEEILGKIEETNIKGAFIIGADPLGVEKEKYGELINKLDYLVVQDMFLTETAKDADVVLPASGFAETAGTYTNTEGRVQEFHQALPSVTGVENSDVFAQLASNLGKELEPLTVKRTNLSPVLYTEGFCFEDGKARLASLSEGMAFKDIVETDSIENYFRKKLIKEELV